MESFHLALADYWYMQSIIEIRGSDIVISDRSFSSAFADAIALGVSVDFVKQVATTVPRPKLTIILDVDPAVALARKGGQVSLAEAGGPGNLNATLENGFLNFQAGVRHAFKLLGECELLGEIVVKIDAHQDFKQVSADAMKAINDVLAIQS